MECFNIERICNPDWVRTEISYSKRSRHVKTYILHTPHKRVARQNVSCRESGYLQTINLFVKLSNKKSISTPNDVNRMQLYTVMPRYNEVILQWVKRGALNDFSMAGCRTHILLILVYANWYTWRVITHVNTRCDRQYRSLSCSYC